MGWAASDHAAARNFLFIHHYLTPKIHITFLESEPRRQPRRGWKCSAGSLFMLFRWSSASSSFFPHPKSICAHRCRKRTSYLKGEVGTGPEGTAVQSQDTTRMVWCDKNTLHFNLTLAGRIQYQNPKAMQGLRQIKLCLCIISTAVFGYGHHNSNSPSELANNPTPKSKNSWCAQKYCSEAEKILQALTPLARQSPSCWLLI